jgi:8-oxo-dGTP diphosphatase
MSYSYNYPRPAVTADAVIFRLEEDETLEILLIRRNDEPFKGKWALPGGFLDENETLEECVAREVEEETGLAGIRFYQLEAFSQPDRDPRGRTITVAFWGFCKNKPKLTAGSDATDASWIDINLIPELAFDHDKIIKKALKRAMEIMADKLP